MDSYKTPVPALRGSLLKESSATQNPAASQKAEDLRERIKLTLERKAPNGYGIGLARDRKHEGVFIVSLLPGGVADSDGRSRQHVTTTIIILLFKKYYLKICMIVNHDTTYDSINLQ